MAKIYFIFFVLSFYFISNLSITDADKIRYGRVITLGLNKNGNYCCSEGDCYRFKMSLPMNCQRPWKRLWEFYCLTKPSKMKYDGNDLVKDGDIYGLRSYNWNTYCAVEQNYSHVIHCNRMDLREWEYFTIKKVDTSIQNIKCPDKCQNDDSLYLNDGDAIYLFSTQWNKYCASINTEYFDNQLYCDFSKEEATIFYISSYEHVIHCDYQLNEARSFYEGDIEYQLPVKYETIETNKNNISRGDKIHPLIYNIIFAIFVSII